jgi:hypothetical protein
MTYSSSKFLKYFGFGRLVRAVEVSVCSSSLMISLQISMHSLQTYTPGPAISFFTSFCDLPQNEQHRSSSGLRKLAIKQLSVVGCQLSVVSFFELSISTTHSASCQSRQPVELVYQQPSVQYRTDWPQFEFQLPSTNHTQPTNDK